MPNENDGNQLQITLPTINATNYLQFLGHIQKFQLLWILCVATYDFVSVSPSFDLDSLGGC